jgi:hypothetical protein
VTITAVTPPDAASDPVHPDHDRWVKEKTLRMEIEHAQLVGLSLRHAEAENARMLARAEQRAKEQPAPKAKAPPSEARAQRHAARGITRRAPKKRKAECACGLCTPCKRKMRVLAIFQRRASSDAMCALGKDLGVALLALVSGKGSFAGMRQSDAKRAFNAKIDAICDRSVPLLGGWR